MSYPQPDANQYVQKLYQFWNLTTPLSSPGDIYQSEQGSQALCIGPDSDVANVAFAYYDDQLPTFMHFGTISPARSFTSLIAARLEQSYQPGGRPGRIFFWSADIYDPNFRPTGFDPALDNIQFEPPILNVVQYFQPALALVPQRTDREYAYQVYRALGGGKEYVVLPYYGRKYCFIQFTNGNVAANTFGVSGVNYAITQNGTSNIYHQQTVIHAAAAVAHGNTVTVIVTTQNFGMFDALVFSFSSSGPAPLRVIMSDRDQV